MSIAIELKKQLTLKRLQNINNIDDFTVSFSHIANNEVSDKFLISTCDGDIATFSKIKYYMYRRESKVNYSYEKNTGMALFTLQLTQNVNKGI